MKEFIMRFKELLDLLKNKMPPVQFREIQLRPIFNPLLGPERPSDLFFQSFDGWFIALPLIRGGKYGPFYRIDGDHFWPQDSDGVNPYSEAQYFIGLKEPKNQKETDDLYDMRSKTSKEYVHEFIIDTTIEYREKAEIYVGPVRYGTGYQLNPNIPTANIIRNLIIRNKVKRKKLRR